MFFEDGPKRLNVDANHLINSKKNTRAHTAHTPLLSKALFAFFFQAEDGIRDSSTSRGLGDVYKRQP